MVIALIATSTGSCDGDNDSMSTTTDVSRSPRARRCSGTWVRILVCDRVEVSPEPVGVDVRCVAEHRDSGVGCHEAVAAQWCQFSDGYPVARDGESLALIEQAHYLAAFVSEFALCDRLAHDAIVAPRATTGSYHSRKRRALAPMRRSALSSCWQVASFCARPGNSAVARHVVGRCQSVLQFRL
jgi:hypothetical protein